MSIPHLHVWRDPEDPNRNSCQAHLCEHGEIDVCILPWPRWTIEGNAVRPSFNCGHCGTHEFGFLDNEVPEWLREWWALHPEWHQKSKDTP